MMQEIIGNQAFIQPVGAASSPSSPLSLDRRLAPEANGDQPDGNIDRLCEQLKQLCAANPDIGGNDILDHLSKFTAEDGSMPYKSIPAHAPALAQIMNKIKAEGGEGSPIYAALYKSMGLAVVSNGILNNFIGKMVSLPETPEPW